MTKIVKLIILVILLSMFGNYIYQYLKRNGMNLFSFAENATSFVKKGVVKSIDAIGFGNTAKKIEDKLSPSSIPAPPSPERSSTLAEPVNIPQPPTVVPPPPRPDSSTKSAIQQPPQKGYCYVGTDRGYRSCIYVKDRDSCMSEQIFPSKAVCEYPGLRPGMSRSSGWYYYKNGRYQLYTPEPYFNDHYYQQGSQSGSGSSQRGSNGSSQSGYSTGDQFDFTQYYDMRGAGDKSYNGTYRDRDAYYNNYGSKTKSMSQYIAQQDRNVKYGGRGETMPTAGSQTGSSSMLYSS